MMNFVAICLVVTSLAAAGVWSPTPEKHYQKEQVIVKEGHRVVVVEYDEHGQPKTKVSISPASVSDVEQKISSVASDAFNTAKDKIREASSILPNLGQGLSGSNSFGDGRGPGKLVCDGVGNCKHKIASAMEKAKDQVMEAASHGKEKVTEAKEKVSEAAHETIAFKKEMDHKVIETVQDAFGKAKESASEKAYEAKEAVHDALGKVKEGASEKAHEAKEVVQDALGKVKEGASQAAHDVKESAKDSMAKAKHTVKETKDLGKTIGKHVAMNLSEQIGHASDSTTEKAKEAKEGTEHAAKRVKTGAHKFSDRFFQYFYGMVRSMGLPETMSCLMDVLNLLGFATAYGMNVWVTFVSSYVLAEALPRQQFGMVQSKIYAVYFRAMACSIGLALLGHTPLLFSGKAGMFQGFNLLTAILMVFANSMYLEPRATKVMFERMKVEKEEGRGRESLIGETSSRATERPTTTDPAATTTGTGEASTTVPENIAQDVVRSKMSSLSERLKKLNSYSSILNVMTLMSLCWHLVYLAQRLQKSC